jgi:hypothetical protein
MANGDRNVSYFGGNGRDIALQQLATVLTLISKLITVDPHVNAAARPSRFGIVSIDLPGRRRKLADH